MLSLTHYEYLIWKVNEIDKQVNMMDAIDTYQMTQWWTSCFYLWNHLKQDNFVAVTAILL